MANRSSNRAAVPEANLEYRYLTVTMGTLLPDRTVLLAVIWLRK